jgi:hypothetical protein
MLVHVIKKKNWRKVHPEQPRLLLMYLFVVTERTSSSFKLRIYATVTHKMFQPASVNKYVSEPRALQLCVGVCMCGCACICVCVCVCVGFVMCVCVCVGFVMCGCVYVWVL